MQDISASTPTLDRVGTVDDWGPNMYKLKPRADERRESASGSRERTTRHMRSFRGWLVPLAAGVALSLIAAACSSGTDTETAQDDQSTGAETPADDAAEGDPFVLRVAASDFGQEDFDPASGPRTGDMTIALMVYDTILDMAPDGSLAPGLAEEWEIAEDGESWTFNLRQGVPWHDGWGEVTADDVKFSLERMMSSESVATGASLLREQISDVEVIDEHVVRIHTNGRQPFLPFSLSPHQAETGVVLNAEYLREVAGEDFEAQRDALNEQPIGTGPFQVVEHRQGDNIVYESIDSHWRNTPEIDRLELLLVPDGATQVAMLQSGEVDIIDLTPPRLSEIEGAGFEVKAAEGGNTVSLVFNHPWRGPAQSQPTADPRVRQALSMAIDRQLIIDEFLGGRGSFPSQPHMVAPDAVDLDADAGRRWAEENLRYDPDAARDLLAEAGYADGLTIEKFFAFPRPGLPNLPDIVETIEAMWREIDVDANIVSTDWGSIRAHVTADVEPDDDFAAGLPYLHATGPRFITIDGLTVFFRTGGTMEQIQDEEFDRLLDEAPTIIDDAERLQVVTEAVEIANDSWTTPMLFNVDVLFGTNPDKVGEMTVFPAWPFLSRSYETVKAP